MYKIVLKPYYTSNMMASCPQRRAVVQRVLIITPKRPNSARRKCVRGKFSNKKMGISGVRKFILSYVPGSGHTLKKHSKIYIKGGGPTDLPCVYSICIRGSLDLRGVEGKSRRRSIYGIRKR